MVVVDLMLEVVVDDDEVVAVDLLLDEDTVTVCVTVVVGVVVVVSVKVVPTDSVIVGAETVDVSWDGVTV